MTISSPGHREEQIQGSFHTRSLCLALSFSVSLSPSLGGVCYTPLHACHPDQSINENSGSHCLVTLSLLKTLELHSSFETSPRKT